ncbi:MAG: hypothetical protein WCK15_10115 [Pirellula sp.]
MSRSFVWAGQIVWAGQMVLSYAHCILYISSAAALFGSITVIDAGGATWNGALTSAVRKQGRRYTFICAVSTQPTLSPSS